MTYQSQSTPWTHQQAALDASQGREAFAFLMAMRTGKTKVTLDDFGRLEDSGKVDDLLIIAPAAVYETWRADMMKHLSLPLMKRIRVALWSARGGPIPEEFFLYPGPRALLVNVEALSSVQRARELCARFLGERRSYCVVDESTSVKNPSAQRTKFVMTILAPLAQYRRILSGLPSPQSPLDLYAQFAFLDRNILNFKSFSGFRARYAILRKMQAGGRHFQIVVGYKNLEDLAEKIKPHSFRVLLEDCYDLPPKMYSRRVVELTEEQRRVYKELKTRATAELGGAFVTATEVVTQILRLHQVLCGHAGDELGQVHAIPENRTKVLLQLLEEYDGKAVIWCSYDYNIRAVSQALADAYGDASVAKFWGGNRAEREGEEQRFKADPACRWMVATAAAGGRGREWSKADLVIYYSNSPNLEHRSQSEERAQAVGKTRSVAYVDLVAPGTVDEKILKILKDKITLSGVITGDAAREWLA